MKVKKKNKRVPFNILQDNKEEIDEVKDNLESIAEEMLITSEKVQCPIETSQSVDIRVVDKKMNAHRELYQTSDKRIDSHETISDETKFTSSCIGRKKLENTIADSKSARNPRRLNSKKSQQ